MENCFFISPLSTPPPITSPPPYPTPSHFRNLPASTHPHLYLMSDNEGLLFDHLYFLSGKIRLGKHFDFSVFFFKQPDGTFPLANENVEFVF